MKEHKKVIQALLFAAIFAVNAFIQSAVQAQAQVPSTYYSWGSTGDTIRTIQDKLSRWGYYQGPIDGKFGYLTSEAVKYFQRSNGLKEDGIAGQQTLEAMGIFQNLAAGPTPSPPGGGTPPEVESSADSRENDLWLLACVINGEGRGESYLGQVAIGAVVMNRVKHSAFPGTITGVVYQPGAFDAVWDGQLALAPTQSCINAARDAMNGWDPVEGSIYYWNPQTATSKWVESLTVFKTIGNHVFAKN